MKTIPTGDLPFEMVEKLPKKGEENKIYGVENLIEDSDIVFVTNYRYHKGKWEEVNLDERVFSFQFADYQEIVVEEIEALKSRLEAIEGGAK